MKKIIVFIFLVLIFESFGRTFNTKNYCNMGPNQFQCNSRHNVKCTEDYQCCQQSQKCCSANFGSSRWCCQSNEECSPTAFTCIPYGYKFCNDLRCCQNNYQCCGDHGCCYGACCAGSNRVPYGCAHSSELCCPNQFGGGSICSVGQKCVNGRCQH